MNKIIIFILTFLCSLGLVSALSITNNIPSEVNQYEIDINSLASCTDFTTCNITFSPDNVSFDLPYTILQEITYTGSFFGVTGSPKGVTWDGTYFWTVDDTANTVYQYTSTGTYTGFNFNINAQDGDGNGITWDGTHLWVVGDANNRIYKYTTAGSYTGTNFFVGSQDTNPSGITWDGTHFWVAGNANNKVYKYTAAGSYTGTSFNTQSIDPSGITWDGEFFLVVDFNTNTIYQHAANGTYTGVSKSISAQDTSPRGLTWDGSLIRLAGDLNNRVYSYTNYINELSNYTFTYNGNQSYTIFASNSTTTINETGVVLVNPTLSFQFNNSGTPVTDYTFGGRSDTAGIVNYNIYNDGLNLGLNSLEFAKGGFIRQFFNFTLNTTSTTDFAYNVSPAVINVNIYDRSTEAFITDNVSLQLVGPIGDTTSTITGQAVMQAIDGVNGDYQIIASTSNYETESIYFTYDAQSNLSVDIYMIQSNQTNIGVVNVEVKDTLSFFIESATVNLLEWKPAQSSFITVAQCSTGSNGRCLLNVELFDKLYKFQAVKGSVTKSTNSQILSENNLLIPITLEDQTLTRSSDLENFLFSYTKTDVGNQTTIRYEYTDLTGVVTQACIKTFKDIGYSQTLLSQNCSSSSSGILFKTDNINNTFNLKIKGTVTANGVEYEIGEFLFKGTSSLTSSLDNYNFSMVLPVILFLLGIGTGLFFGNIYVGVILGLILEWIATILIPSTLTITTAVSLTVLAALIMWGISKK